MKPNTRRTHAAYRWQRQKARLTLAWFACLDTWDDLHVSRAVGRIVAPILGMVATVVAFLVGWALLLGILAMAALVMAVRWIIGPRRRPIVHPSPECLFVSGDSLKDVATRVTTDPRFFARGVEA